MQKAFCTINNDEVGQKTNSECITSTKIEKKCICVELVLSMSNATIYR